ncbi:MAG TPA: hypothetical protein VFW01_02270 [bacterium]|nr:hypothetical protein [bacterium]
MKRRQLGGIFLWFPVLTLLLALAGPREVASASPVPPTGWAVLLENNWYGGLYPDLQVGYVNSTRMLNALIRRGWPADHILLVRDTLGPNSLQASLGWLAAHVRDGETALLYIAGEYYFFADTLRWQSEFPALWSALPTSRRVLVAETCFAERLTRAASGIPGIALPAVGPDEWNLWGLRPTGGLIQGGAFTHFLAGALEAQPNGAPLAFPPAFSEALTAARTYYRAVLTRTPEVLAAFHSRGAFPERLGQFPNPHLLEDAAAAQVSEFEPPL